MSIANGQHPWLGFNFGEAPPRPVPPTPVHREKHKLGILPKWLAPLRTRRVRPDRCKDWKRHAEFTVVCECAALLRLWGPQSTKELSKQLSYPPAVLDQVLGEDEWFDLKKGKWWLSALGWKETQG